MSHRLADSAIGIDARQGRDPVLRGSVRSTRARPPEGDRPSPGRLVTLNGLAGGMLQSGLPRRCKGGRRIEEEPCQRLPTERLALDNSDGGVESALGLI